jgi:hypothetical protein
MMRGESGPLLNKTKIFIVVILSQGAVGYVQYFRGLPELIVGIHLLGSTLVWIAAWSLFEVIGIKLMNGKVAK